MPDLIHIGPKMKRAALRPPAKIFGGKSYLATAHHEVMNKHFPNPSVRADVFGGGGSWLLNAPDDGAAEFYNDLDPAKFTLMRAIHHNDSYRAFVEGMNGVKYCRETWDEAVMMTGSKCSWNSLTATGAAIVGLAVMIRSRMSRGGMGKTFGTSKRLRGGQDEYANSWETIVKEIPAIRNRVKEWHITNIPALKVLSWFGSDAMYYLDPPYLPETRTAKKVYDFEMTFEQHVDLLAAAKHTKAFVGICGYRSDLYDTELSNWHRYDWHVKNNSGQGKTKSNRVECLWINR